ncbi:MAG: flavin reductase family protein [Myxococcota bacterium]
MELDPAALDNSQRYKLLTGTIVPRPIAFVSTLSPSGVNNLAPFSFFNGVSSTPMAVVFCPNTRSDGTDKDTLRNLLPASEGGLGEFVLNVAAERYGRQMAATAANVAADVDEFALAGFTPAASRVVRPPRVLESPVSFECRTTHVIQLGGGKPGTGNVVIGEVVHIWVEEGLLNERFHVNLDQLSALGRLSGNLYTTTAQQVHIPRGLDALREAPALPGDVGTGRVIGRQPDD